MTDVPRRQRRGHGRPTLHDVASAAGVTRITVSRFLREPQLLADDTARRVKAAIDAIGYVPNHQAGQLASGHSRIVATLIPNVGHSVFAETIQGLSEGLRDSGYELLLTSTGYSLSREEQQLRAVLGWSPAALIVTGRRHSAAAQKMIDDAQATGIPTVEIWDQGGSESTCAQIGFDHEATGQLMARHLVDRGHRELGYVDSSVVEDYRAHERQQGFVTEAGRLGARVRTFTAPPGDALQSGRQMLPELLTVEPALTAVAFANDHLASGALLQAQALGVEVPQRLALLGFGDFPIGRHLHPGLSTVHTPTADIGRLAAQAVLSAMRERRAPRGAALQCTLQARGSTACRSLSLSS